MFERILRRIRDRVRTGRYIVTVHGWREMLADDLMLSEVWEVVMTGRVTERQRDPRTTEWKYLIEGRTVDGRTVTVVTKLGPTGRLVVITVYRS